MNAAYNNSGPEEANDFELLQLEPKFELTRAQLEERQRELGRILHPDRFAGAPPAQRRAALSKSIAVNEAVRRLKDPVYRGKLLLRCKFGAGSEEEVAAAPGLLMEVMELREQLAQARTQGALEQVEKLAATVRDRRDKLLSQIARAFDLPPGGSDEESAAVVTTLRAQLGELKYLERFVDEVGRIQDDLS